MVNIDRKIPTQLQDYVAAAICGENGFFLDLGCRHPIDKNNTYLLEKYYNWKGLLFDITPLSITQCQEIRVNPSYCMDVNNNEFVELLSTLDIPQFDFISFDIDTPNNKPYPESLRHIISSSIPFKFMTYEHDFYDAYKKEYENINRKTSREFLQDHGYFLLFGDVTQREGDISLSWEDWWVNPELVSSNLLKKSKALLHPRQILDLVTQE